GSCAGSPAAISQLAPESRRRRRLHGARRADSKACALHRPDDINRLACVASADRHPEKTLQQHQLTFAVVERRSPTPAALGQQLRYSSPCPA
ncbi:hypothetical protein, partial [Xanthomonas citri]|uniref:hypothetical protein n=1 Tax=Xanthomonas citri TaxID=346 RepID=UPI001FEF1F05